MGRVNEDENRSKIAITAESKEEAHNLFNGLSAGEQIEMPFDENPDGTYFAMLEANSVLNGWSSLTQKISNKSHTTTGTFQVSVV